MTRPDGGQTPDHHVLRDVLRWKRRQLPAALRSGAGRAVLMELTDWPGLAVGADTVFLTTGVQRRRVKGAFDAAVECGLLEDTSTPEDRQAGGRGKRRAFNLGPLCLALHQDYQDNGADKAATTGRGRAERGKSRNGGHTTPVSETNGRRTLNTTRVVGQVQGGASIGGDRGARAGG